MRAMSEGCGEAMQSWIVVSVITSADGSVVEGFLGAWPGTGMGIVLAWQACRTLSARRMSPLLRRTNASVASGVMLIFSLAMTLSTS